jgi:hypothetical protein
VAATPSIKIVKSFSYKNQGRTFSNRYHFNGGTPADAAHWHTLMDNVTAIEKTLFPSSCKITEAVGYAAGSDLPVASKTYSLTGTNAASGTQAPGDTVMLLRWSTAARSVKNHPVYLFNYYHGAVMRAETNDNDLVATAQLTALGTFAADWISGFSDGTLTLVRAGPNGATATGSLAEEFLTHRDFPPNTSV